MPLTTTPSERIGRCTTMRRFFVRFNRLESFVHRSSAGFTIITAEFSVHTGSPTRFGEEGRGDLRMENCDPVLRCPLLRPRRPRHGGKQHAGSEFPPPHLITLSARAEPLLIWPLNA